MPSVAKPCRVNRRCPYAVACLPPNAASLLSAGRYRAHRLPHTIFVQEISRHSAVPRLTAINAPRRQSSAMQAKIFETGRAAAIFHGSPRNAVVHHFATPPAATKTMALC